MIKVTIVYGHPASEDAFERYYANEHRAIASKMTDMTRVEITKCDTDLNGGKPAFYRMAELYFEDEAQLARWKASPAAQAALADLPNFATGGFSVAVGPVITR